MFYSGPVSKLGSHNYTENQAALTLVNTWEGHAFQLVGELIVGVTTCDSRNLFQLQVLDFVQKSSGYQSEEPSAPWTNKAVMLYL